MFEKELEVYFDLKSRLTLGRFVLIHGDKLIGIFDADVEALVEGTRRFGRESFLVREVRKEEPVFFNPALSLGILRASSTY